MAKQLDRSLSWKCDTPALLKEILNNPQAGILKWPLQLFANILSEVSDRCIEINDPILNELMCDLRLYETPNPATKEYQIFIKKVRKRASDLRIKKNKK